MIEVAKHDVVAFNKYVKDQLSTLTSRDETSSDIIVNLFKGYKACTDHEFTDYIKDVRNRYEEGEDLTYQTIMQKAEMKYQSRLLRKEWNAPTEDQTELIALRAQMLDLAKTRAAPRAARSKTEKHKSKKRSDDGKKGARPARTFYGKHAWRNTLPKAGESHTKTVEGIEWSYCIHHKAWAQHKSEQCRNNPDYVDKNEEKEIQAAMASAGIEVEDNDEEEDQE